MCNDYTLVTIVSQHVRCTMDQYMLAGSAAPALGLTC